MACVQSSLSTIECLRLLKSGTEQKQQNLLQTSCSYSHHSELEASNLPEKGKKRYKSYSQTSSPEVTLYMHMPVKVRLTRKFKYLRQYQMLKAHKLFSF